MTVSYGKPIACQVAWPLIRVESPIMVAKKAQYKPVISIKHILCSTPGLHNPDIHGSDTGIPQPP